MRREASAASARMKAPRKKASWKESWLPSSGVPSTWTVMGDGLEWELRMRAVMMAWVGDAVVFERLMVGEEVERERETWTLGL